MDRFARTAPHPRCFELQCTYMYTYKTLGTNMGNNPTPYPEYTVVAVLLVLNLGQVHSTRAAAKYSPVHCRGVSTQPYTQPYT